MSFSYNIKSRLAQYSSECEFCKTAELYGILCFTAAKRGGKISITTEHEPVYKRIKSLFADCIGFIPEDKSYAGGYRMEISDDAKCDLISEKLHIGEALEPYTDEIMPFECCRISYL